MATSAIYEGLDEIGRLMASLDNQMNLHNTSPVFGVGRAPNLGFKGAVLHAKVSLREKQNSIWGGKFVDCAQVDT